MSLFQMEAFAGPSEGDGHLWRFRAQKTASFEKIFSDHFVATATKKE
jgi:hypothetical protein